MEDEDAPIRLLTKNLDKMYAYEQKLKREAAGQKDGFFSPRFAMPWLPRSAQQAP